MSDKATPSTEAVEVQQQEMQTRPEPTSNEPVEEPTSVAATAADAGFVRASPLAFLVLSVAVLALLIIGTALPWLRTDLGSESYVSLWSTKTELAGVVTTVFVVDYPCAEMRAHYRASESFAIIAIVAAAGSLVAGAASIFGVRSLKPAGTVFAGLTVVAGLIAWAIAANALFNTFCDQPSYRDQRYYVYSGAGVFIAGWTLSIVALIISLTDIRVPKLLPDEAVESFLGALVAVLSFAAFVFAVISVPIPIVSKWMSSTTEWRITVWHLHVYVDGHETQKTSLDDLKCGDLGTYGKFSEAFTIISIATSLIGFVVGLLAVKRIAGLPALLVSGLVGTLVPVIAVSADLALYYKRFCTFPPTLDSLSFHRDAGVALIATTAIAMAVGFLVTLFVAVLRIWTRTLEAAGSRRLTLLYLVGIVVSLLFSVISLTTPVFRRDVSVVEYTKVYWWQTTATTSADAFTQEDFQCQKVWERLVGGGALGVIAIGLTAIGALIGLAQLFNGSLRKAASALTLLAAILQLTAFALVMAVYQGDYCNFKPYATQYKYAVGFGLMVAAFCVNFLVSLMNLLVA